MDYKTRFDKLNPEQRQAVETIDGPLMVIAGPGTGKTELLSMRVANILKSTDTLAENILCLTFTDSGVDAMRSRLRDIIGEQAYKVSINTFHSFGMEVINQNSEYFFYGAQFKPADDLATREVITSILDELETGHVLTSKMNGQYTHFSDLKSTFGELKRSGMTSTELLGILGNNEATMDTVESDFQAVFAGRVSKTTLALLVPVAHKIAELSDKDASSRVSSFASTLALSLAHAVDQAQAEDSTKPITAWKNSWFEKDSQDKIVFKSRKKQAKLRLTVGLYDTYISRLQEAELFDFDDMILQVVHAIETNPDLGYNLQERYQYILVDEFQDTNMAQARILHNLTYGAVHEGRPNIMVVGDDDQAIYSFQGAEVSNILNFSQSYRDVVNITLTQNYRSSPEIIKSASQLIKQGSDRLTNHIENLDKTLTANRPSAKLPELRKYNTPHDEYHAIVKSIADDIANGVSPSEIAVLAHRHKTIVDILPYFTEADIPINYERKNNVLQNPIIIYLNQLIDLVVLLAEQSLDEANALLPEVLSHPMWNIEPEILWKLSLSSYRDRSLWLETMLTLPELKPIADWLIETSQRAAHLPLEQALDMVIGHDQEAAFVSPFFEYYFGENVQQDDPRQYLEYLESLRAIRDTMRSHDTAQTLADWLTIVDLYDSTDTDIKLRSTYSSGLDSVSLMTAHKSKGLEFDSVYILDAIDSSWGRTMRKRSRNINYPENLPLSASGANYDERLRLFFVAMTRAKRQLVINFAEHDKASKPTHPADFLINLTLDEIEDKSTPDTAQQIESSSLAWYAGLVSPISPSMKELLQPRMAHYQLSATHLGSFLDIIYGGPQDFLMSNILHFPSAMSPSSVFGSAIHTVLRHTLEHKKKHDSDRPIEDCIGEFSKIISESRLSASDKESLQERGALALNAFLEKKSDSFTTTQTAELNFKYQNSVVGEARLTGSLDVIDIDQENRSCHVIDYKTGKPLAEWALGKGRNTPKLHRYKQQLMFYKLLVENSRDYSKYTVDTGSLMMVEPTVNGDVITLDYDFSEEEMERFQKLIQAVWQKIINFDFPDISNYPKTYKGMLAFEDDLIESIDL